MLQDGSQRSTRSVAASTSKKTGLKKWFGQNKGKGWVDCKTGKPCGRSGSKDKRKSYPACRPTKAACKAAGAKTAMKKKTSSKRVDWKKK